MKKIRLAIDENRFAVFLRFLQTLDYVKVLEETKDTVVKDQKSGKYNFSDLMGKLAWQGDPLKEQQRLRDEW